MPRFTHRDYGRVRRHATIIFRKQSTSRVTYRFVFQHPRLRFRYMLKHGEVQQPNGDFNTNTIRNSAVKQSSTQLQWYGMKMYDCCTVEGYRALHKLAVFQFSEIYCKLFWTVNYIRHDTWCRSTVYRAWCFYSWTERFPADLVVGLFCILLQALLQHGVVNFLSFIWRREIYLVWESRRFPLKAIEIHWYFICTSRPSIIYEILCIQRADTRI